jgi:hypothetical protein
MFIQKYRDHQAPVAGLSCQNPRAKTGLHGFPPARIPPFEGPGTEGAPGASGAAMTLRSFRPRDVLVAALLLAFPIRSETTPAPFQWGTRVIRPVRVIPLDHDGKPTPCVDGRKKRPCALEVTARGEVFDRFRSSVGNVLSGGLSVNGGQFRLAESGELVGTGPYFPEGPQVLFCRMTKEPALRCHHEVRPEVRGLVCNEKDCKSSYVVRVEGATLTAVVNDGADSKVVAARIEPAPQDDSSRALALFLYAMHRVDFDVEHHTPAVDDSTFR